MLDGVVALQERVSNCPSMISLLKLLKTRLNLIDLSGVSLICWIIEVSDQLIIC